MGVATERLGRESEFERAAMADRRENFEERESEQRAIERETNREEDGDELGVREVTFEAYAELQQWRFASPKALSPQHYY